MVNFTSEASVIGNQGCGSGSAFIFPPGSVDPDPRGKNFQIKTEKCKEIGNSCKFNQIFKVNLNKLQ